MKQCLNCGTKFTPKNPKGVYCSDKCRVAGNRKKIGAKGKTGKVVAVDEAIKILDTRKSVSKEKHPVHTKNIDEPTKASIRTKIMSLKSEIASPPKNTSIGQKLWIRVREQEIAELEKQLK